MRRLWAPLALVLLCGGLARAQVPTPTPHKTVAVLEYRAGTRAAAGMADRLARLLKANAALLVIDPQEARRRSARIDGEVKSCAGEATCVGAIGQRLGAEEVLLVGVSQLGDVIIALQRIDSRRGEAGARLAESLPPDGAASDGDLLGWLQQLFPPEAFRRYAEIRVVTDVDGAAISLNGVESGVSPLPRPVPVRAPASYRVRVTKAGYMPFQARLDVLPDSSVEVRATMVNVSAPTPWFKRWYVWAIVGGTAAALGAGIATYYGTRVDETPHGFITTPR